MNINIAEVARQHTDFIEKSMSFFYAQFSPSDSDVEELFRRAAFLVRHNYVKVEDYNVANETLLLSVQDASLSRVQISFSDGKVKCTCPSFMCRHEFAAVFFLYQYIGSLAQWLEEFRDRSSLQLSLTKHERTPESWLHYVKNIYKRNLYPQQNLNPYILDSIFSDMTAQIRMQQPIEREWKHFYLLFTQFALLSHTWKHLNPADHPSARVYYNHFIEREVDNLMILMDMAEQKSRLFAFDPFYKALRDLTHSFIVNEKNYPEERYDIYMAFWSQFFTTKKEREEEFNRIKQIDRHSVDAPIDEIKAYFLLVLEKEDELDDALEHMKVEDIDRWSILADMAISYNFLEGHERIIRKMIPLLKQYIFEVIPPNHRTSFIRDFDFQRQEISLSEEELAIVFDSYGKYGIQPFSQYLIEEGRYEEWVALHQLHPTSLAFLEICGLKTVLDEKPSALLPLFHALSMEEIQQKTRDHYKAAVRILKKMKTASKKSGKNEFWNDYVLAIRKKFKRMRALQEELEKGNLML